MHVKLHDVADAPLLSYSLISLPYLALEGHMYAGDSDVVTLKLKEGRTLHFPLIGRLCWQYGYRPEAKGRLVNTACVVIAPGQAKAPTTPTDINTLHCTHGHTHEVLLKKTAEQQGIKVSGELHDSGDLSALMGRPAQDLEVFGEPQALQSGCTRSQSRGLTMSASYADALLAYPMRTVEANRIVREEVVEIERVHDSLPEELLEKER